MATNGPTCGVFSRVHFAIDCTPGTRAGRGGAGAGTPRAGTYQVRLSSLHRYLQYTPHDTAAHRVWRDKTKTLLLHIGIRNDQRIRKRLPRARRALYIILYLLFYGHLSPSNVSIGML